MVKLEQSIAQYASQPMSHQLLVSLLKNYKSPNDKINEWVKQGQLISLRRGLYVWNSQKLPELFSIANVLLAPSYISAESAMSYHGLIPEQVFTVVSMSLNSTKKIKNSLGNFEYKKLSFPYYSFGIQRVQLYENQFALIASPEKAMLDKVVTTSGVLFRSMVSAQIYLSENLRIDSDQLKELDIEKMKTWLVDAPKKESINYLIKAIETL
ncbi:type IV toxin-antitoxin system AbiEi family antitoxin domain-containing protein [Amniculibacterium aquaticum]|uniref:type IV toxin-antitoxin system AbiEi family antitoxin domain-containing protein n=1 Tax=Amniculibacterium aquaticum TaxID=2479858 RepID=UPI000F5AD472|nr:hypothetical protein [Amniculibacterium aquaticum]